MVHFDGSNVHQSGIRDEKTWPVPELFETCNPLWQEPLDVRHALFRQILPVAERMYDELSGTARLHVDFWKNLRTERIVPTRYKFSVRVTDTYRWELEINPEGLFFKDVSRSYDGYPGQVHAQLLSDFWFYGPLMPLPELQMRKEVLACIRQALEPDNPAYNKHFTLFEYPKYANPPQWTIGNHTLSDFVILRDYGVEYGRQNWHDGLVSLGFLSFEYCLYGPGYAGERIGKDILADIRQGILDESFRELPTPVLPEPKPEAQPPQLPSEAPEPAATPPPDTETALLQQAASASDRDKQDIARRLWEDFASEKSLDVLLPLLDNEDFYWRDYVFSALHKMRQSRAVRQWVVQCLQGDNEVYFKKAAGVLQMWGILGYPPLQNPDLLKPLQWTEKTARSDAFKDALNKIKDLLEIY